jgi:hypothetical protein
MREIIGDGNCTETRMRGGGIGIRQTFAEIMIKQMFAYRRLLEIED